MNSLFAPNVWTPHNYQETGIEWLLLHPAGGLCFPPGLGKTSVTLAAIKKLFELKLTRRFLIVAPLRVCQTTWMSEYKKWADFAHFKVGLAHGIAKEEVLHDLSLDIVVINYDAIPWLTEQLKRRGCSFDGVVFDEITKLKHTNTKRFKTIKDILPKFRIRWGLTGTPAANGLLDLFGQVYCLDLGQRFGRSVVRFRLDYFFQKPYDEFNWYITPDKEQAIHNKVKDLLMYIDPKDVLKLPDIIHIPLEVTLPASAQKAYKEMEAFAITKLQNTFLTAANAAVITGKLRQITGGRVYDENRNVIAVHDAKLDALDDLIEEMAGEPLMVAFTYTHELNAILERYPKALCIHGGSKNTFDVINAWNTGQYPLLVVQTSSAARGLNLQTGGAALCWFSQTYNLEEYIQLNARLHRQGQTRIVRVYHLIAARTIDADITKILEAKNQTQESLFTALRNTLLQKSALQLTHNAV